ncbi:MAG: hypothetical protein RLY31_2688 [Bacteroidota bacterium]
MSTYVAIMAGGIGSRFWPASRPTRPKQFLDILGVGKSLLRLTYERFLPLVPAERILVVTHAQYRDMVMEHLPELSPAQVLCEPSRNNTGPSVAYTALHLQALDPDANFVMAPADHIILREEQFLAHLRTALDFTAQEHAIVTLGIRPTRPDTGYGYIHFGKQKEKNLYQVRRFMEKPVLSIAKRFVESGEYLWNAGIFVWRAQTILEAYLKHATPIYDILTKGADVYGTDREQAFIDAVYPTTPRISVDYAILEKSESIYTIPVDIGWSDLGTWASLHHECQQDDDGNVKQGGRLLLEDVSGCMIRMPEKKVVLMRGMKDFIIVDDEDVLLIWPIDAEQHISPVEGT